MKNEVKEVLDEELVNDLGNVNKPSKGAFLGIAAAAVAASVLLFKFRKKIGSGIDKVMVNKLTKKGYSVCSPKELEVIGDDLLDDIK